MRANKFSIALVTSIVATTVAGSVTPIFGQVPSPPKPGAPAIAQPQNGQAAPAANVDGMRVLDQGPIHEAFAEAVVLERNQMMTVNRQPPEPINEMVPEVRPEGENIEWIPGYWMWSDEQNDFIWVSGVWRDVPPGRRWVPGHWTAVDGSFQWAPGFWAGGQVQEVNMLPLPPETLEVGPSSPAPGGNYFWVPGCWLWNNGAYGWRAGYWYAGQQNWVWIPDRYCYTPRGVIFVSGYWDYLLAYRGLAYAPVWWPRPVWGDAGWSYRPYSAINSGLLLSALYLNRRHHHYYFGHGRWNNDHYRPWYQQGGGRGRGYDPFCAYHRWHDGRNRDDWANNYQRNFDTFQRDYGKPGGNRRNPLVSTVTVNRGEQFGRLKLQQASKLDLDRSRQQIDQFKNIRTSRETIENRLGEMGKQNFTFDDLKNGRVGDNGPQRNGNLPRPGGRDSAAVADPGKLAATQRDVIRSGGKQLDLGGATNAGRAAFKLPPVEQTAKAPIAGSNSSSGAGFVGDAQRGSGRPKAEVIRGGNASANGMKFEDFKRQFQNGGGTASVDQRPRTRPGSTGQLPSGDVVRSGNSPGQGGGADPFRSNRSVQGSDELRRQLNLDGSRPFPQGNGRSLEGRARIEMPQNRLPTPQTHSRPPVMQFQSRNLEAPRSSGSPSSRMNSAGSASQMLRNFNGGGEGRSTRGTPSVGGNSGGAGGVESRNIRGPSGGGAGPAMRSHGGGGSRGRGR